MKAHPGFWPAPPPTSRSRRVNWYGVLSLVLLAISAGMMLAWVYTIIRLLEVY